MKRYVLEIEETVTRVTCVAVRAESQTQAEEMFSLPRTPSNDSIGRAMDRAVWNEYESEYRLVSTRLESEEAIGEEKMTKKFTVGVKKAIESYTDIVVEANSLEDAMDAVNSSEAPVIVDALAAAVYINETTDFTAVAVEEIGPPDLTEDEYLSLREKLYDIVRAIAPDKFSAVQYEIEAHREGNYTHRVCLHDLADIVADALGSNVWPEV